MRASLGLLVGLGLGVCGCGGAVPTKPTAGLARPIATTASGTSLLVTLTPDQAGGLRSSAVLYLKLTDQLGASRLIDRARLVVRDAGGAILLSIDTREPTGTSELRQDLVWSPASAVGRTLEMSITTGAETIRQTLTF